jgi:hypothetical protein
MGCSGRGSYTVSIIGEKEREHESSHELSKAREG